jgi:hypothetical protein
MEAASVAAVAVWEFVETLYIKPRKKKDGSQLIEHVLGFGFDFVAFHAISFCQRSLVLGFLFSSSQASVLGFDFLQPLLTGFGVFATSVVVPCAAGFAAVVTLSGTARATMSISAHARH